ncbi:hypothetical protein L6R53_11400 [Myxococcota bacterium]|nr:hypothetical protein [Myxococcota bacterium]
MDGHFALNGAWDDPSGAVIPILEVGRGLSYEEVVCAVPIDVEDIEGEPEVLVGHSL